MPTIGKINFKLTAVTGQFQNGMRRAQKAISRFGDKVKSSIGGLINFRSVIGALLGGAGLGLLVKRTLDEVDALAKAADNIGTTTQALRGLQLQANLSGVATEKLTKGVKRYLINIGDAVDGTGEAGDVLKDMGLSAKALAQLGLVESVAKFADALKGLGTQAERANAMSKLFGRTGADLAVFFKDGSKGIRDAAEMAEKFGTAISRIDANKIEQANDAMRLLREAFAGVRFGIVTDLAPLLTGLFNGIQSVGNKFIDLRKFAQQAMFTIIFTVSESIDMFLRLRLQLNKFLIGFETIKSLPAVVGTAIFGEGFEAGISNLKKLLKETRAIEIEMGEAASGSEGLQAKLLKMFEAAEAGAKKYFDSLKLNLGSGSGSILDSIDKATKKRTGRIGFKSAKEVAFGGFNESRRLVSVQESALDVLKNIERKIGGAVLA